MSTKTVIIQGSSRSTGNTHSIVKFIQKHTAVDIIDLKTKDIGPFDYGFKYKDDDFIPLIRDIADNYDTIIFATPVYWYTMSGIMKNFFDRISDCLKVEKETGRKLRGKSMGAIACGYDQQPIEAFFVPFKKTAAYLGMDYLGDIHTWIENEEIPLSLQKDLESFAERFKFPVWKNG